MTTSRHLSQLELLQVLKNDEAGDLEQRVEAHVIDCESCRGKLESLAASPELWRQASSILTEENIGETIAFTSRLRQRESDLEYIEKPDGYSIDRLLEPPRHPEMLGRIGHYEVEREIGRGGMGVVLKAHDTELNRAVAIKMMAPHLACFGVARQRFAREARAAAAILHPNVIAIHAVSTDSEHPWLVMPYIVGPSLEQIVLAEGALDERDLVRFAMQIAAGLAAAHSQGVVHRDIKPANVLIESGMGRVVITDFGLARAEADASMTQTGWFAGTPNFMSPEQARGQDIDHRSDLFSLGSVMYYMATGRLPFRAESPMAVLEQIRDYHPVPPRQVNSRISRSVSNLIQRLLAKQPDERLQSASEVHRLLEQYLAYLHHPETRSRPEIKAPVTTRTRRRFGVNWLEAVVAVAVIGITATLIWLAFRTSAESFAPASPGTVQPITAFQQIVTKHQLVNPTLFDADLQSLERGLQSVEAALQQDPVFHPAPGNDRLLQNMQSLERQLLAPPPWTQW